MMMFFLFVVAVGAVSAAPEGIPLRSRNARQVQQQAPVQQSRMIPITQYMNIMDDSGQFSLMHTDALHTTQVQRGILKPTRDGKDLVLVQEGSFQYISPEGEFIKTSYQADENGFRPIGDHIPVAPVVDQAQGR